MECKKIKEKLYLYSAEGLSRRWRTKITKHLSSCPECMDEFHAIEMAIEMVEKLPQEKPPEGMWNKVLLKIKEKEKESELKRWSQLFKVFEWVRLRPVSVISAFAFIVLIFGGIYFFANYYYQTPDQEEQSYMTEFIAFSLQDPLADKIALGRMMGKETITKEIKQ